VPILALDEDPSSSEEPGSWPPVLGNAALTVLAIATLILLLRPTGLFYREAALFAVIPLTFFFLSSFRVSRSRAKRRRIHPALLRFRLHKYLALYIVTLPFGLLLTGWVTVVEADRYGERASYGMAVRDPTILGLPFLGVRAEPALIAWKSGMPPPEADLPRCAFYLGGSSHDIFYDRRSRSTFRVPAGQVIIELNSDLSSCKRATGDLPIGGTP
jgi:hypothetical protein